MDLYKKYVKRIIDVVISTFLLVVLSPIIDSISILILIKLGRPVFFKQERPGLYEKTFMLYKFRTMLNLVDQIIDHYQMT